ncbi:MAG: hypothetical protein IPN20_05620 [Haliscomenobacter sp.]|nr:hypothetical protein [Haliscomenobacter sp.]
MELKIKIILISFLGWANLFSQNFISIKKAEVSGNMLLLKVCNWSDSIVKAPILEYRHGKGSEFTFSAYYDLKQDTLLLNISSVVDSRLISIRSAEGGKPSGKLLYVDKMLKPKRCYTTSAKIENLHEISYLALNYEKQTLNYKFKSKKMPGNQR